MTTERILPAIALRAPGRAGAPEHAGAVEGAVARPAVARPRVAQRSEAFLTTPARAGILFGTSAAVYALSLAAVAGFQASDDAALAARTQPFLDALAEQRAANDALEAVIGDSRGAASTLAGQYAVTANDIAAYEARLDDLAALVAEVRGSAAALPTRIRLPSVSVRAPVVSSSSGGTRRSAPATTTTSRASGG